MILNMLICIGLGFGLTVFGFFCYFLVSELWRCRARRPRERKLGRVPWRDAEFTARARREGGDVIWFGDVEKREKPRGYFIQPGDLED